MWLTFLSNFLSIREGLLFSIGKSKSMRLSKEEAQGMASHNNYEDSQIEGHNNKLDQVKEAYAKDIVACLNQPSFYRISPTLDVGLVGDNLNNHCKEKHNQDTTRNKVIHNDFFTTKNKLSAMIDISSQHLIVVVNSIFFANDISIVGKVILIVTKNLVIINTTTLKLVGKR